MRVLIIAYFILCFGWTVNAQSTETIYLSGTDADNTVEWDFYCSKGMKSGKWRKIEVPSCWEQQGFGEYTYGRYYKKEGLKPSDETGHYRHSFKVPKAWNGRKVEIVFEGVMTDALVTINGEKAGDEHQGGFTRFSYDISKLLRYGKSNTIEVTVEKQSKEKSVNSAERRADWWLFGGIYRPVYLRALPAVHIDRVAIDAKADGNMRLRLFTTGLTDGYSLRASIDGLGEKTVKIENNTNEVNLKWQSPKTWDTEHPNLYNFNLSLVAPDGTVAHTITERIGFRTIEFRRRDGFYLNGTKIRVKGVNRHCFYPETGRTTSKRLDIEDVRLVKQMNANAIRSHYPPDSHLLDICDSLGVLYFNELPGWQNCYKTAIGSKILAEMINRDVNHPCIFAWGNGNEGGFNLDLDPLFAKYDIQNRHVVHPWALFDGVDAHHYPAYQTGVARLANGYEVFMPTEFLHSQYDKGGGASLDDFWANYSRNPLFAGGFIWAMIDEGVMRTDRNGEIDTDGSNAPDGLVGPHREKEGSWYTVRDVWSPIQIAPLAVRPGWNGHLSVSNNWLFSRLDECSMTYEVLSLPSPHTGNQASALATGKVTLPPVCPGESGTAVLTPTEMPANGDILRLTAFDHNGDTINIWTYPLKYADEYFAGNMNHAASLDKSAKASAEGDKHILESSAGVKATFDTSNGMLLSVTVQGNEIPFGNGPLPIGMKADLQSITARKDNNDALLVMHYKGAVDSIVWRMTSEGILGMDAVILNRRNGGGYEGGFFDKEARNLGFSFSYPEEIVKCMRWMGKGPYRVWRNRQRGTLYNIWQKEYNNTITGESTSPLVYPEFKGYHANLYWAQMQSDSAPFTVYSETDGLYFRVFTPEEPKNRTNGARTMPVFPEGDLSFLLEIPAISSYKPVEQLGPQAQPSNIRINPGDDGLRIKLWFDFRRDK